MTPQMQPAPRRPVRLFAIEALGFTLGAWAAAVRDVAIAAFPVIGLYALLQNHLPPLNPLEVLGLLAMVRFALTRSR